MTGLYGDLWGVPEIRELWLDFNAQTTLAQQFGYNKKGIGGKFTLEAANTPYHSHRPNEASKVKEFHANAVWKFDSSYTAPMWPTGGVACSPEVAAEWFGKHYLFPKWFFDWGKAYLDQLRRHQPDFNAAPEQKLVWVTHVAWTLNMMLSATNVHGTVLPLAIYSAATGRPVPTADPFISPSQHFEAFPAWWHARMNDAVANLRAGKHDAKGNIDFGYAVLDMDGKRVGVSYWQGAPWSAPFETKRLRWDATGLAGATFNGSQPNDPTYVPDMSGNRYDDKGKAIHNYTRWSYAVPWVIGIQQWGTTKDAKVHDKTGTSMLREALQMSTFFGWDKGDARFWAALTAWKASPSPKLVQVRPGADLLMFGAKVHVPALYQPNAELSFRYHYPAMIDTLLQCDYAELVAAGYNAWWLYNIGPKASTLGVTCDKPGVKRFNSEGAPRRDADGIPLVQAIAPSAVPKDAHFEYKKAKEKATGISFGINWVSTWINVVQIIFQGDYTKLYDIGKGWYDHFTMKFPKPEDLWRGVVPPSPVAMRTAMVSRTVYDGRNWVTGYGYGPEPTGQVVELLQALSDCVETWTRHYGAPLVGKLTTSDFENVWVGRKGKVSPQFALLPEPGSAAPPTMQHAAAPAPTNWLPLAAAVTAVGAFAAYRIHTRGRR